MPGFFQALLLFLTSLKARESPEKQAIAVAPAPFSKKSRADAAQAQTRAENTVNAPRPRIYQQ
ncbi:hypothetical protein [Pyruvatibacter sp.]|uniref:hypothetical protein n=1 Tax=Pyruvatibacter sp. TaxID=1981328 RepID=UPI0032EF40BD